MRDIEDLEQDLKKLEKEIKELKENKKENVRNRVNMHQTYYSINSGGTIHQDTEDATQVDKRRYEFGNYFKTKEEAEKVVEKLKIYTQLKDLALRLNNGQIT